MSTPKPLPARPSLESLRKQAKKLARDTASGDADAIARVQLHAPKVHLPLTQRNAQLVVAREYGYDGWQELTAEVSKRLGTALEWATSQARRAIHDDDVERLTQLLADHPALLSWEGDDGGGVLGMATMAFGDSFEPERERSFTRAACAEVLIDAGAVVTPSVLKSLTESRARGLLELFHRKGVLPRTLEFLAARGEIDAVRAALADDGNDRAQLVEAFVCACRFQHEAIASLLLDRLIALDPALGARVDASAGRTDFVGYFIEKRPAHATAVGLWNAFVMEQVRHAIHDDDLSAFTRGLRQEPWLLGDDFVDFQVDLIETATLNDREAFIIALLEVEPEPALLRRRPPPAAQAIEFALTYATTHLLPLLTRIWPLPDDLPHAAGTGHLSRVKSWFDESGAPALGDIGQHYPANDARARGHLQWNPPTAQHVLDTALAFSVINRHFDVADFLLAHGADIDTSWNSHEPASILHHLVFLNDSYDAMRFLIDRGIDLGIRDYRWNSNAYGWALHGKGDAQMADWLQAAERARS